MRYNDLPGASVIDLSTPSAPPTQLKLERNRRISIISKSTVLGVSLTR